MAFTSLLIQCFDNCNAARRRLAQKRLKSSRKTQAARYTASSSKTKVLSDIDWSTAIYSCCSRDLSLGLETRFQRLGLDLEHLSFGLGLLIVFLGLQSFPGWSFSRIGRFPERRFPGGRFPGLGNFL